MYALETAFAFLLLAFLAAQVLRRIDRRAGLALGAAGLVVILLIVVLGQMRWQMAPAYLLWAVLALSLLVPRAPAALRAVGAAFGALLLAAGLALSAALPIMDLPAPEGPYAVGAAAFVLTDAARDEARFGAPDDPRRLTVQVWYPAETPADGATARPRTLWRELYAGEQNLFTKIFGYLRGLKTHTVDGAALAEAAEPFPLILFSHGMTMGHPEQNTLLMEHLASHGFVVAALGHPHMALRVNLSETESVDADFEALAQATGDRRDDVDSARFLAELEAAGAEERAAMWAEYFDNSTGLNDLMAIWVADMRFAAAALAEPDAAPGQWRRLAPRVRTDRIGVMGMSFGGGAVAEFCKTDARCAAGLNLDGGAYGARQREPLAVPYMALVNPENDGVHTFALRDSRADFYEVVVADSAHTDFMDVTLIAPVMKWTGANGAIPGERMVAIVNDASLAFFDAYLRAGPPPRLDPAAYPELTVRTNSGTGP